MANTTQTCKKCGISKLATAEYFNMLEGGKLRGTCKACMAENTRRHYQLDPDKVKARAAKYHEMKKLAGGCYAQNDIDNIRRALNDRCRYCGTPLNGGGEVDHIIPISRGGNSNPNNLTLACLTCNRDKHSKTADEFFQWRQQRGLKTTLVT